MSNPAVARAERLEQKLGDAFQRYPHVFRPLFRPVEARPADYASEIAHIKRFLEHLCADRECRRAVEEDPQGAMRRYGFSLDPEELRLLWDREANRRLKEGGEVRAPRAVQRYRIWIGEKLRHRGRLRDFDCVPQDERHARWRERQVRRGLGQLGPASHDAVVHAPFCIELSDGCSVGCWFCGVSAKRKTADFLYTPGNARLWRETLAVLRRVIGPAAATGFCYWATDPLDNPDYERFCLDFARICGRFPQTTTAQPLKDVDRTRALLRLSVEHGCAVNRFSILSRSMFYRVMEAFTAEELLDCELVNQNHESNRLQTDTGKARGSRRREQNAADLGLTEGQWREAPGTIACVSGFLLNMVHRRVQLVTPCPASERWPNGHWLLEEAYFSSAAELERLLDAMMARHMPTALRAGDSVRLRPDLAFEQSPNGFSLKAYGSTITFEGPPKVRVVGEAVAGAGGATAGEIAVALEDRSGLPAEETMHLLNQLFDSGVLDEEPPRG